MNIKTIRKTSISFFYIFCLIYIFSILVSFFIIDDHLLKKFNNAYGTQNNPHQINNINNNNNNNNKKIESKLNNSSNSETGFEINNKDNWIFVNHDIHGTRNSDQTQISLSNIDKLEFAYRIDNEYEIQEPPLIIGKMGYYQDYIGNIYAFNITTGQKLWKVELDGGPTMGLYYSNGVIFATIGSKSKITAINGTDGNIIWISKELGNSGLGYTINSPPLLWKNYLLAGSGGSGLPPGLGYVKGNITALNKTNGNIIWNIDTTKGEWVSKGKTPPNGGATAWSGGSIDEETGIAYIPLGSASPNFNSTTRQSPNLYSNHMIAVDIKSGKIIWAIPFIAHGTVLNVSVPDTHDWDTSWGSSINKVTYENSTIKKIIIGHDKMGNLIAMDGQTGKELWWMTLGKPINIDNIPQPNGSGIIWAYGVYNFHATDSNTLYITATNRGLNFFTDGLSGHKIAPKNSIEQGLVNGTIYAIDLKTGKIKWKIDEKYPPRVSPLVTSSIVFTGYIKYSGKDRSGIILALDKNTGKVVWQTEINGSISPVGPSIGNGMLFVPTDKIKPNKDGKEVGGSIMAYKIKPNKEIN